MKMMLGRRGRSRRQRTRRGGDGFEGGDADQTRAHARRGTARSGRKRGSVGERDESSTRGIEAAVGSCSSCLVLLVWKFAAWSTWERLSRGRMNKRRRTGQVHASCTPYVPLASIDMG